MRTILAFALVSILAACDGVSDSGLRTDGGVTAWRGPAGDDALPAVVLEDAEPVAAPLPDAGADLLASLPEADPEASPDVLQAAGPEIGADSILPAADTKPAAGDAAPPLPDTCPSVKVKASAYCPGYWLGSNSTVRCGISCLDYAQWTAGTATAPMALPDPLRGCYSWDMTSSTTGRAVVCLAGESFCAIYCPVTK